MAEVDNEGQIGEFSEQGLIPIAAWTSAVLTDVITDNNTFGLSGSNSFIKMPLGRFLVKYQIGFLSATGTSSRAMVQVRLTKNGTEIQGSRGSGYTRVGSGGSCTAEGWAIVNIDSYGSYIDLQYRRDNDNFVSNLNQDRSRVWVVQLDNSLDYGAWNDNNDSSPLGDATNGTYDVEFSNEITSPSTITQGVNDIDFTLSANRTYLIVCGVDFVSTERTSRMIYPKINGNKVDGIRGHAYGRNSTCEFCSPNFMFIHKTGNGAETLSIESVGSLDSTIGDPISNAFRVLNASGLYIAELPNTVEWWYSRDLNTSSGFTIKDYSVTTALIHDVAKTVVIDKTKGGISKTSDTRLTVNKKSQLLISSCLYGNMYVSSTSRTLREAHLKINGISSYRGSSIKYNRGVATNNNGVIETGWSIGGFYNFESGDYFEVYTSKEADSGWNDAGSGKVGTTHSYPNSVLILNLDSLRPQISAYVSGDGLAIFGTLDHSDSLRETSLSRTNWSMGKRAGNHGMFEIPGESDFEFKNKDTDISLGDLNNYYGRFYNDSIATRDNPGPASRVKYWYVPFDGEYDVCFYKSTDLYRNDNENVTTGSAADVYTTNTLSECDRISADAPITVYSSQYRIIPALFSGWGGYKFGYETTTLETIIIYSLDDQTNVSISRSGQSYRTSGLETFSASISNAHSYVRHTVSGAKSGDIYLITSNKPVVAGIHTIIGVDSEGCQLYPMEADEELWGSVSRSGNGIAMRDKLNQIEGAYTLLIGGDVGNGSANELSIPSTLTPSEWFMGSTNSFQSLVDNPVFSNAGRFQPSAGAMMSITALPGPGTFQMVSKKSWNSFFTFDKDFDRISFISNGTIKAEIYTNAGWKVWEKNLEQLGTSGVYYATIAKIDNIYNVNTATFEQGGFIILSDVGMVIFETNGAIRPLAGSNEQNFTIATPNLIEDVWYTDTSSFDACGQNGTITTIYGDGFFVSECRFFYSDVTQTPLDGGSGPLVDRYYAGDFILGDPYWVFTDGNWCQLLPTRC